MDEFTEGLRTAIKDRLKRSINRYAHTMDIHPTPGWLKGPKREQLNKDVVRHIVNNPSRAVKYAKGRVDARRVEGVRKKAQIAKPAGPRISKSSQPNQNLSPYQISQLKNQISKGTSIYKSTSR